MKKIMIIFTILISSLFLIDNVSAEAYESFLEDAQINGVTFSINEETGKFQVNGLSAGDSSRFQIFVDNIDNLHYYVISDTIMLVSTSPLVYATGNYGSNYYSYGFMSIPGSTSAVFNYFYNNGVPWFSITDYATNSNSSTNRLYGTDHSLVDYIYTNTDVYQYDSSNSSGTWENLDNLLYEKNVSNNTLKLKNMFNSGTNAYGMSKIIWNINASSDVSAKDGIINFKIQYGANDFTNKNIPIFNSYKIYGYNEFESGWTDITSDERFYFDDFVYEYYTLEGTATETVLTSTLNIPSDICVYEQIKVEFYFDNTNNFYMYVFDDLDNSTWEDMQYYFENYIYYEFPSDMKYAFITHKENNRNVGKVYVPYNDIINPNSLFGAYIYDTQYKSVSRKLQEIEFTEHNYYYYYDFDFSFDNNEVLLLQRKTGTDEKVSFYLPSDFIVEFANDDENITILTPNGYIDIDSGKVENVFSNDSKTFVDYLNIVRNYITSIGFYITNFFGVITYFLNSLPGEALTAIITIFIVLCACVIIKLIRK